MITLLIGVTASWISWRTGWLDKLECITRFGKFNISRKRAMAEAGVTDRGHRSCVDVSSFSRTGTAIRCAARPHWRFRVSPKRSRFLHVNLAQNHNKCSSGISHHHRAYLMRVYTTLKSEQLPVGLNAHSVPFGIGLLNTAWSEPILIKWTSSIEDLMQSKFQPQFRDLYAQNVPIDYSLV